jgi:hypothetical protein
MAPHPSCCVILLKLLLLLQSLTSVMSNGIRHIELTTPLHKTVVVPGTNVVVAYKVSEWFLEQKLKGACLVLRSTDDVEKGEPQVLSCIDGIDSFGIIPNAPGDFDQEGSCD